jgi:xylose isomerase
MLGSIDANQGDSLLGWDTDQFPTDVYNAMYCMYEVIKAGGFTTGGLNFDAKQRRGSYKPEDTILSYIAGMDAFALGLRLAYKVIDDGRLDDFVKERYQSYSSGIGADIVNGRTDLEKLSEYALSKGEVTTNTSGRQEMLENLINSIMFKD